MTNVSQTELIPLQVLFGNPVKTRPRVSPDGRRIAYLAPVNNVLNIWVGQLGGTTFLPVTHETERGIRSYFWAADNKHLLYLQDVGGNENWHLYMTHLETRETRDLTPFADIQVRIIARDKHFPGELLIAMNKEKPKVHDVYHLNLDNGELTRVAENPGNIITWVVDSHFKVRGATAALPDGSMELLVRDDEQSPWHSVLSWTSEDALTSRPVVFTVDGQELYLIDSRHVNGSRLIKLNFTGNDFLIIAEDAQYDVGAIITHPDTHEIQAAAFNKERVEWQVLDKTIQLDFDRIREICQGDFSLVSRDFADNIWILAFTRDNGPVQFYAYNRTTQHATFLFDNQPELSKYPLAQMLPVTIPARDGLTLHGYLTLPTGEQRTNLPLVLHVHGGPWSRNTWGYHPEAQWLANRGYACLQVNFRGSTGYGKAFLNAGVKEWGHKMHNDLVDSVNWAIQQGIADPQKVAIYGSSYGGYAALVGATFTPDLFCCAIDIAGPGNLVSLLRSFPPYWSTYLATFHKHVGNPDTEEEFLQSRSPLFFVDRIQIPMLIVHGANDPRVKQAEAEQIVEAMKRKGINYKYMLFPDEGHGLTRPENRLKFYTAAEKFFAAHLGGRYQQ